MNKAWEMRRRKDFSWDSEGTDWMGVVVGLERSGAVDSTSYCIIRVFAKS